MFGPNKKDLTPLGRHGAVHKVAGKGHAPFHAPPRPPGGGYAKTAPAMQAPMAAHANPLPPPNPAAGPIPSAPMMNPAQSGGPDDTSLASQSAGI